MTCSGHSLNINCHVTEGENEAGGPEETCPCHPGNWRQCQDGGFTADLDDSARVLGPLLNHPHLARQRRELINSAEARLTLLILMAQGAPGKPGRHVLKAEISLKGPRPQALIPATRNL